jgi:hypothetical protein
LLAVVRVAHRRPDLGVAEPVLQLDDRLGAAHGKRPERMAEVVEADWAQPGASACGDKPPAQSRPVDVKPEIAGEHQVVVAHQLAALAQTSERLRHFRDHRDDASAARLGRCQLSIRITSGHADRRAPEVDIAPPQRDQLAAP